MAFPPHFDRTPSTTPHLLTADYVRDQLVPRTVDLEWETPSAGR